MNYTVMPETDDQFS